MSNLLGESLRFLRKKEKFTQAEMQAQLGFPRTTWASYESGQGSPSAPDLIRISDFFGVSIDEICRGTVAGGNLNTKSDSEKFGTKGNLIGNLKGNLIEEKAPIDDKTERMERLRLIEANTKATFGKVSGFNVYDLDGRAAAGQAIALLESDKVKAAPTVALPELGPGLHIRITAEGDSMYPTVKPGDRPVGTWVSDGYKKMREGAVHLVIDTNDEIAVKRLYFGPENTLRLDSDNEMYPPYSRHLSEFRAIFEVKVVCSSDMRPYMMDVRRDIRTLQTQMEEMQAFIGRK